LRLVYLAQSIIPSRRANSIHVMKMCQALALAGHDVRLLVPAHSDVEPGVDDVHAFYGVSPIFRIDRLLSPAIRGQTTLSSLHAAWSMRRWHPDLLYSRAFNLCERVVRFSSVPVALELHRWIDDAMAGRFRRLIDSARFRGLIATTHALAEKAADVFPRLAGRIAVVPNGAEAPRADLSPMSLRRGNRLVAGYCGNLFEGKGIGVVIDLARAMPEIDFHLVGGRDLDVIAWRERAGVNNLFFHGFVQTAEAQRYIAAFDVALAPFQRQVLIYGGNKDDAPWMSPLKLFEYMAAGKAIVSSDVQVLREILADGQNALLCAPDDLDAWVAALQRLRDQSERNRLGENARRDFQDHYSWDRRAERVLAAVATA
jgi:glycosyltransferase involved in cell wall biosynthesis